VVTGVENVDAVPVLGEFTGDDRAGKPRPDDGCVDRHAVSLETRGSATRHAAATMAR
jgi:hypothetical protein